MSCSEVNNIALQLTAGCSGVFLCVGAWVWNYIWNVLLENKRTRSFSRHSLKKQMSEHIAGASVTFTAALQNQGVIVFGLIGNETLYFVSVGRISSHDIKKKFKKKLPAKQSPPCPVGCSGVRHTVIWWKDWLTKCLLNCTGSASCEEKCIKQCFCTWATTKSISYVSNMRGNGVISWYIFIDSSVLFRLFCPIWDFFSSTLSVAPITAEWPNHFTSLSWWNNLENDACIHTQAQKSTISSRMQTWGFFCFCFVFFTLSLVPGFKTRYSPVLLFNGPFCLGFA